MRQLDNVAILKVPAAGKDPAKQNGGVHRRDFRVPDSFPGIDVGKVVEESAMRRQRVPKKSEGRNHAQASVLVRDEGALFCNADRRQAKAGGCNACHHAGVGCAGVAAVFNQAGLRAGLLPEEEEVTVFKVVQELLLLRRKGIWRRYRVFVLFVSLLGGLRQRSKVCPWGERQTKGDTGHLTQ